VEWLCHDINWHVPHHVMSRIPWYNLRPATESLRKNWGEVRRPVPRHWLFLYGCPLPSCCFSAITLPDASADEILCELPSLSSPLLSPTSQYMTEGTFNWKMMKTLFTQLHIYDEKKNYVPFDYNQEKEDAWLAIQRRVLPA
jgi:omega-6 fatty acid desaturase (delta-12 desaturase)